MTAFREPRTRRHIEVGLMAVIVLLGAFLRLSWLGHRSLWLDEILTAGRSLAENVLRIGQDPLHIVAAQFCMAIFGNRSEFVVRLPSAMAGILCIPAMFRLGKSFFSSGEALIGACLLAISPLHLNHSQEARHYAFFTLFSILSLISFDAMLKRKSPIAWVRFALTTALNLLTHKFALFLLLAEVLTALAHMVWLRRRRREQGPGPARELSRQVGLALGLIALVYIPSILLLWRQLYEQGMMVRSSSPVRGLSLSSGFFVGFFADLGAGRGRPLWPYLGLFLVGLASSLDRHKAVVSLNLLGLVVPLATLHLWRPAHFFSTRYMIFLLPLYLLAIARGAVAGGELIAGGLARLRVGWFAPDGARGHFTTHFAAGCLAVLLIATTVPRVSAHYSTASEDWRGVAAYLRNHLQEGDVVLCDGVRYRMGGDSYRTQRCLRYYLGEGFPEDITVREPGLPRIIARIGDQSGEVWAVVFRGPLWLRSGEQAGVTVVDFPAVSVVRLRARQETLQESGIAMLQALVQLMPKRDATVDLYLALAELHADSVQGHVYTGNAHLAGEDVEAAISEFELAVEMGPDRAAPHTRLGDAYKEQGRFEDAIGHYHQALELRREWDREPWVHMRLADAYRGAGCLTEATEEYRRVLELKPDHAAAKAALSELGR